jgi:hypothetical protein
VNDFNFYDFPAVVEIEDVVDFSYKQGSRWLLERTPTTTIFLFDEKEVPFRGFRGKG